LASCTGGCASELTARPHVRSKQFTPTLGKSYARTNSGGKKKFEVVYVSSDNDEAAMYKYMTDKHGDWAAVAYDDPMRQKLKKDLGFFPANEHKRDASFSSGPQNADPVWTIPRRNGIPTLAVIGTGGELLSAEANIHFTGPPDWDVDEDKTISALTAWLEAHPLLLPTGPETPGFLWPALILAVSMGAYLSRRVGG
jgi:hypothetical protein